MQRMSQGFFSPFGPGTEYSPSTMALNVSLNGMPYSSSGLKAPFWTLLPARGSVQLGVGAYV